MAVDAEAAGEGQDALRARLGLAPVGDEAAPPPPRAAPVDTEAWKDIFESTKRGPAPALAAEPEPLLPVGEARPGRITRAPRTRRPAERMDL